METQLGAFHNSRADSSEKSAENSVFPVDSPAPRRKRFVMGEAMQAAISLAKRFGLPLTHRNLYVIELAIEAEKEFRQISVWEAAANIREGAMAEAVRGAELNYFFFEDARWRPTIPRCSQADFDERDLRLMGEAMRKLMHKEPDRRPLYDCLSQEGVDNFMAEYVGVPLTRIHELRKRAEIR